MDSEPLVFRGNNGNLYQNSVIEDVAYLQHGIPELLNREADYLWLDELMEDYKKLENEQKIGGEVEDESKG